jgi:hypothetical protein
MDACFYGTAGNGFISEKEILGAWSIFKKYARVTQCI